MTFIYLFTLVDPRCYGNEIWDKIGYNLACVIDICEIFCICKGVFGNGSASAANQILPWPTLVAKATKFKTKWAISRFVQQISPRSLHLIEVWVEGLAIRWRESKSTSQLWFPGIMSSVADLQLCCFQVGRLYHWISLFKKTTKFHDIHKLNSALPAFY